MSFSIDMPLNEIFAFLASISSFESFHPIQRSFFRSSSEAKLKIGWICPPVPHPTRMIVLYFESVSTSLGCIDIFLCFEDRNDTGSMGNF